VISLKESTISHNQQFDEMHIPGLNLLNGTTVPATAPHSLLPPSAGIESSLFTTTEDSADVSKTSETENASSVDQRYDDERSEEKLHEVCEEDGIIKGRRELLTDPLDLALEADSHHSSGESEADREEDSHDAATYDNFLCMRLILVHRRIVRMTVSWRL